MPIRQFSHFILQFSVSAVKLSITWSNLDGKILILKSHPKTTFDKDCKVLRKERRIILASQLRYVPMPKLSDCKWHTQKLAHF